MTSVRFNQLPSYGYEDVYNSFPAVRMCSVVFSVVRMCSVVFPVVRMCSVFFTVRRCISILPVVRRCSVVFPIVRMRPCVILAGVRICLIVSLQL